MEFSIELYQDEDTGRNMVFISANDGASGASYPYKNPTDLGTVITNYIQTYYPDALN